MPRGLTLSEDEVGAVSPALFDSLFLPELAELSARYGFALDAQHIRPHRTIVATQCPGTIDVDRIVLEASQEEEMTDEEFRRRWLAVYADIEAAKLFDTLKQRDADLASDIALHKHDIPIVQTDTAKLPPR